MKTTQTVRHTIGLILASLTLATSGAMAQTQNQSTQEVSLDNHRLTKRLGAYVGILGDPHPTILGFNLAYNAFDFMRASIGFGKVSVTGVSTSNGSFETTEESVTTIGTAAKFLVPNWNLSPSATLGYSHVSLSEGFSGSDMKSSNLYIGLGADWQAESGFNVGAGINLSMNGGASSAPYINLGKFF